MVDNNTKNTTTDNTFDFTRLRKPRTFLGINLETVVQASGISLGYLNRLERGFVTPKNQKKFRKLKSYILSIEVDYRAEVKLLASVSV